MSLPSPSVSYFRPRIDGPESRIEDAVVAQLRRVFTRNDWPIWLGGSVPIGAGFPDVVSVWYDPQVLALAEFDTPDGHILAYLRSIRSARIETIAQKLRYSHTLLEARMRVLEESDAVLRSCDATFAISPAWRQILPEVVTVEAKVADWQSALQQAIRNRIFAHRSYVALPGDVAIRIMKMPGFALHGVGVLAVEKDGDVHISRRARRNAPSVWSYYFHLAALTARDLSARGP